MDSQSGNILWGKDAYCTQPPDWETFYPMILCDDPHSLDIHWTITVCYGLMQVI